MRSGSVKKRQLKPDLVYKSVVVTRFVNNLMLSGKRTVAEAIVYGALESLSADSKDAVQMFEQAVKNVMPEQEVRSRRVGGATYQVPMPVKHDRAEALAIRWLIQAARSRSGKPMSERLSEELKSAFDKEGTAMKRREDVHRMADANRAFAHFARY